MSDLKSGWYWVDFGYGEEVVHVYTGLVYRVGVGRAIPLSKTTGWIWGRRINVPEMKKSSARLCGAP